MKWRNFLQSIPIWLLLLVMASQIYNMVRQSLLSFTPVMISRFHVDFQRCSLGVMNQVGSILSQGMQEFGGAEDRNDIIVGRFVGGELRIAMQLKEPGTAAFEKETRLLKTVVDCGTSPRCEGRVPLEQYSAVDVPFVQQKRAGENVVIPSCAITDAEFRPEGWDLETPKASRIDLLAIIALVIETAALYYLLRKPRTPATVSAK